MTTNWQVVHVSDRSDVGAARRNCVTAMEHAGLRGSIVHDGALVVTELATNLLKHAKFGRLYTGPGWTHDSWVICSLDRGPGLLSIRDVLADGYSSSGTIGSGLGSMRRRATRFHLDGDRRTRVLVQLGGSRSGPLGFALSRSGVSGDAWCTARHGGRERVAVFDANGTGPFAASAAAVAVQTVLAMPLEESLASCLRIVHQRLEGAPRGVVGAIVDLRPASIRWCGVGDVGLRWENGDQLRMLELERGLLGRDVGKLEARTAAVDGGWLVATTDGVQLTDDRAQSAEARFLDALEGASIRQDALGLVVRISRR
jgi:anti-sigma regulatory factor (Ser/Thr protein kinase)